LLAKKIDVLIYIHKHNDSSQQSRVHENVRKNKLSVWVLD
jgi:hypothetical protein